MPWFKFSAAKQDGEVVSGVREAENEKALAQVLRSEGIFLLKSEVAGSGFKAFIKLDFASLIGGLLSRLMSVGIFEKMLFTKNLAVMIAAGLSLTKAVDALIKQSPPSSKLRKILVEVNSSVMKGKTLADSLRPHEDTFGVLYINMIEVGELTGKLTLVLKLLAGQMKKDYTLRKRVKGALIYPAIIIVALFGIGALMMIFVVPTLASTIKELGVPLPLTTRMIIALSDFISNYTIYFFGTVIGIVVVFWRLLKTAKGKIIFDHLIVRAPLFGSLVKKFNAARFARTLAYLIISGVPIVKSLEIVSKVVGNVLYQEAVRTASVEIQKGKQLNEILASYPKIFQPMVIQMIKVGEETGKIGELLLRVALFFEEDVNETTKNMSTIIEPLLMVIVGVGVGFFAISMMQPIYGSLGNIG